MQKRSHSFYEALANTALGVGVSYAASFVIYPLLGMQASWSDYAVATAFFTVLSVARSYLVRRIGNRLQIKGMS